MTNEIISGEAYTQKGSKFFAFVCQVKSVDAFKKFMNEVKKTHKKASHYCYAYIINESPPLLSDGALPVHKEKYSNDGEPSGCGAVLLNLLKQNKLENCAVIVVRYFGGILLGAGNLIRAYASAAKSTTKKVRRS